MIGGSRYFGRRLIGHLRDAGVRVTVLNRGSTAPPAGVEQLCADRNDEAALRAALGERRFDVVVDQVCYTPVQAAIAARVFAERTRRYVLTSTVEVYAETGEAPVREEAVDPSVWPVDLALPWGHPDLVEAHYAEGKRQAEAVLTRAGGFETAIVRTAHVVGGADFTGRLAHYVRQIERGEPVRVHADPQPASFVQEEEIARFLAWTAAADFTGPVNAASDGALDVRELCAAIGRVVGVEPVLETGAQEGAAESSPYSFERCYAMDNGRARRLGFEFSSVAGWLPQVIKEARA
ncbi:SDR family oxidoreductase [Kitasatospora viridis]